MNGSERRDPAEQIAEVATLVQRVLGDDAIGAYLHGSTAAGTLQQGSDLDVLMLSRRPTSPAEKQALVEDLLRISGRGDPSGRSRSVELTIVVQSDVRPWRYPPKFDFQYGDWLRAEFERGDLTPWTSPNPDVALLLGDVLASARPIFGPPPAEVLDPVPGVDIDRAMIDGIPDLLENLESDTANVVLTFARIWTTLATGVIRSKDAAADWCLERLPGQHRAVLERARGVYIGEEADRWEDIRGRIRPDVDAVLAEIDKLR